MFGNFKTAVAIACFVAAGGLGCDKGDESAPQPERIQQSQRDAQGEAWRSLLAKLRTAPDDAARKNLLEDFIAAHPDHPDVAGAKKRLAEMKGRAAALEEVRKKGIEQGIPSALGTFFVVASVPSIVTKEKADPLAEPLTVQTPEGPMVLESSVLTYPTRVRSHIRRVLTNHAPNLTGERCDQQCINDALGALTKPITGEDALYEGPGRLNRPAVAALLEKLYVAPETELLGAPAARYYDVFRPTIRAYVAVYTAARDNNANLEEAGEELWSQESRQEVAEFYIDRATEAKVAETTGLDPKIARSILGWWIRRYADGTAPLFQDFLEKVVTAYDPEYAPKL